MAALDALGRMLAVQRMTPPAAPVVPRTLASVAPAVVEDTILTRHAALDGPPPAPASVPFEAGPAPTLRSLPVPPGDSLVLALVERDVATDAYDVTVYADVAGARVKVGQIYVFPHIFGQALDRAVLVATCPGARGWSVAIRQQNGGHFEALASSSPYPLDVPGVVPLDDTDLIQHVFSGMTYGEDVRLIMGSGSPIWNPLRRQALVTLSGWSEEAAGARYVQVHEVAPVPGTPTVGQAPIMVTRVPFGASFDFGLEAVPHKTFNPASALWVSLSSTPATWTPVVSGLFGFSWRFSYWRRASFSGA
jgi:hypothetical protein